MNVRPSFAEGPDLVLPERGLDGNRVEPLPWIQVSRDAPFFETEDGDPWTPIGHNDAVSWVDIASLFRRRDIPSVDRHLASLRRSGVTCLRIMLEYAQGRHRYFERPIGAPVPAMVRLWDDLFALCEAHGLRILLTPFDTYWMRRRWAFHPYSRQQGGPLKSLSGLLDCNAARAAIKGRFDFAIRRWGGSGALFGWDLLNEIHPDLNAGRMDGLSEFVHEISMHIRGLETTLYGGSHPQTVSVYGPELDGGHGKALAELVFRHADLDFATSHFYDRASIDAPKDTIRPALTVRRLVRQAIGEIADGRPFLDTENGPIHTFNNRRRTLPEPFDDEYFRHMQWAHLASGAAGGGMRWPYRHPHRLTPGMHAAQRNLADFASMVDWPNFRRREIGASITVDRPGVEPFACADGTQAIVWLLRTDVVGPGGTLVPDACPLEAVVEVPGLAPGRYRLFAWDTKTGAIGRESIVRHEGGESLRLMTPPFRHDIALRVRRTDQG